MKGIVTGYKNALLRNDQAVEQKAAMRLRVCTVCPMKKIRAGVAICGICGCPLAALARQNQKICNNWKKFNVGR